MNHNKFWFANCIVCIDDFYSNVLLFIAPEITRSRLTTFMTIIAIFKLTHTHTLTHIHRGTYISIALPGLMVSQMNQSDAQCEMLAECFMRNYGPDTTGSIHYGLEIDP